ncbi:ThiF family adenylyltransferase [Xanthomonas campestris pv. raphani]
MATKTGEIAAIRLPLPVDYLGTQRWLRLAFPTAFPRSSLSLRVEPSPWLVWPHAMKTGLCLHGFQEKPVSGSPEAIVNDSLRRFAKIVQVSLPTSSSDARKVEFERESMSYWKMQHRASAQSVNLVQRPSGAGALLAVTDPRLDRRIGGEPVWLAQNADAIASHLEAVLGQRVKIRDAARAGFYVKLETYPDIKAPLPGELFDWLRPHLTSESYSQLLSWFGESCSIVSRWIALELPGDAGAPIYCLNLRDRSLAQNKAVKLGVRAGRRVKAKFSNPDITLSQSAINILDRAEILSRDRNSKLDVLASARVIVVGQGSLGAPVALHLARSGVGHLTLVDPDQLTASNLGRHVLGASDLGRNKAEAMCARLRSDVPIVTIKAIPSYVELALIKNREDFEKADLIVVTSADWESEETLWRAKSVGASWKLIQAWSEPHALVGHALVAADVSADAKSLFEDNGRFRHKYTNWPRGDSVPLPACGQSFIPGGGLGVSAIASMVAAAAIEQLTSDSRDILWISRISNPQRVSALEGEYVGPELPDGATEMTLRRPWPEVFPNA